MLRKSDAAKLRVTKYISFICIFEMKKSESTLLYIKQEYFIKKNI